MAVADHFVWMRQPEAEAWTKWRGLVLEQTQSGQSAAKFCRERNLRVWQFYDWKKRLVEGEVAKFVSVEVKPAELATVEVPERSSEPALTETVPEGRETAAESGVENCPEQALALEG